MLKELNYIDKPYEKKNFSASDFDKWELELYLGLINHPITNPKEPTGVIRMTTGTAIEEAVLEILKMNGIVEEFYDQDFDGRMEMQRNGVKVTGYMDAVTQENDHGLEPNCPVEIKSINNNNRFDLSNYQQGKPRYNYVGQLAVYMDFMNTETGYLHVVTIDGLSDFLFTCKKIGDGVYQCGETIVNIAKEYERWSKVQEAVQKKEMPDPFKFRYKYPLKDIDWKSLPPSKIQKARAGVVLGDWQVTYSPWKDFIIELQGDHLGYSEEELEYIKSQTQGYTTWGKRK